MSETAGHAERLDSPPKVVSIMVSTAADVNDFLARESAFYGRVDSLSGQAYIGLGKSAAERIGLAIPR